MIVGDAFRVLALAWGLARQRVVHWRLRSGGVGIAASAIILGKCNIDSGVIIGENTLIRTSTLDGRGGCIIGSNVIILMASIVTADHDIDSPEFPARYRKVEVGDFAVIHQGALVLPGRIVGRGAVVAAGSVVAHDVPPMALVAGNPARLIRQRASVHDQCDLPRMGGLRPARFRQFMRKLC
ncbi:MAG TPA: hypothetical protein VN829_08900 [Dongiaceae bacterium]|nr:hypothetical protein [Dongiaceae bacterium]